MRAQWPDSHLAPTTIERPVELARLNDAVNRLSQVLITVLRRSQHRPARH